MIDTEMMNFKYLSFLWLKSYLELGFMKSTFCNIGVSKFVVKNITAIHPEKWFHDKLARNCSYHDIIFVFYTSFVYSYRRGTVHDFKIPALKQLRAAITIIG